MLSYEEGFTDKVKTEMLSLLLFYNHNKNILQHINTLITKMIADLKCRINQHPYGMFMS